MKSNIILSAGLAIGIVASAPAIAQDMHPSSGMGRDTAQPGMRPDRQPGMGGDQSMAMHDRSNAGPMGGRSPDMSGNGMGDHMGPRGDHGDRGYGRRVSMHRHCRMVMHHGHRIRRCM